MKKLISFAILALVLTVTSCQKETIVPNTVEANRLKSTPVFVNTNTENTSDASSDGDITDPNYDPERYKRKKKM
jgi:hypothetical protein